MWAAATHRGGESCRGCWPCSASSDPACLQPVQPSPLGSPRTQTAARAQTPQRPGGEVEPYALVQVQRPCVFKTPAKPRNSQTPQYDGTCNQAHNAPSSCAPYGVAAGACRWPCAAAAAAAPAAAATGVTAPAEGATGVPRPASISSCSCLSLQTPGPRDRQYANTALFLTQGALMQCNEMLKPRASLTLEPQGTVLEQMESSSAAAVTPT